MLRIRFMQQWFTPSDPRMEEALYDTQMYRKFEGMGIGIGRPQANSAIVRYRQLLEEHGLATGIFDTGPALFSDNGLILQTSTTVDASIIAAPSSTKSTEGVRDPEIHQTEKGNQWYLG